jgi:hypothetical protein
MKNSLQWKHLHDEGELMAGGHNTTPSPSHTQALASSSFRTKTTDEEEFCRIWRGKKMPNPEEDRHANRSEKSSFKSVESDQLQIDPCTS